MSTKSFCHIERKLHRESCGPAVGRSGCTARALKPRSAMPVACLAGKTAGGRKDCTAVAQLDWPKESVPLPHLARMLQSFPAASSALRATMRELRESVAAEVPPVCPGRARSPRSRDPLRCNAELPPYLGWQFARGADHYDLALQLALEFIHIGFPSRITASIGSAVMLPSVPPSRREAHPLKASIAAPPYGLRKSGSPSLCRTEPTSPAEHLSDRILAVSSQPNRLRSEIGRVGQTRAIHVSEIEHRVHHFGVGESFGLDLIDRRQVHVLRPNSVRVAHSRADGSFTLRNAIGCTEKTRAVLPQVTLPFGRLGAIQPHEEA